MLARKAYDLELHYLSVLCSMQGVGGRWRKAPAESRGAARLTRSRSVPFGHWAKPRLRRSRFSPAESRGAALCRLCCKVDLEIERCAKHTHILRIISAVVFRVQNHPETRSH